MSEELSEVPKLSEELSDGRNMAEKLSAVLLTPSSALIFKWGSFLELILFSLYLEYLHASIYIFCDIH